MTVAVAGPAPAVSTSGPSLRTLAVPLLVGIVYLNLSEALVRYHNFPSVLQILVVALTFFAWLERDTAPPRAVARQRMTAAVAVYLIVLFASTSWALDRHLADERLMQFAKAFVIYLLATLLMRTPQRLVQGVTTLVFSAAGLGLLILYQVGTRDFDNEFGGLARVKDAHIYGDVFQARVAGPLGDPNFFARMLLIAIPPAVMLAFAARERWQRRAFLLASIVILATLATTYSRGAMLALAIMAVMLLHALHVRWRSTFAVALALIAVLAVLPASVAQRFITIEEILPSEEEPLHPDSSFQERKLLMNVAWVMFGANPVGGVGIGNYTERYDDYVGSTSSSARQYNDPSDKHFPHNLALEIAAETGVIGLAAFAFVMLACWCALRAAPSQHEPARVDVGDQTLRIARLQDVTAFDTVRVLPSQVDDTLRLRQIDDTVKLHHLDEMATREQLDALRIGFRISLVGWLAAGLFLHMSEPRTVFLLFAFAATLERLGFHGEVEARA